MGETVDSTQTTNNVDKNIFDLLQKLTDNKSNCRIDACDNTLRLLQRKQDGTENAEEMCNDLKYSVERLVKGLASSRDSARLGFTLLLTEILKHMPMVLVEDVLDIMKKHLVLSKQEKRDNVFGQLFAYSAFVRSGRLAEHSLLSSVVTGIHDLWQGRSYILNACHEILITLFTQLTKDTFEETLWPHLKVYFTCGWETCSADVFWFLLLCLRMFPGSVPEKFLKKHWNNRDIFATENHEHIRKIFKQTTSCLPMLHPTCIEFSMICPSRKDMKDIWNPLVDDNLFELEQSDKSFVGFEIVKRVLQGSKKKKIIECALSPKFRATFTKSYLQKKNLMNPAATHLATFLCDFVKQNKDPNIQMTVLKVFLQPPGSLLSDQVYKKKEVVAIIHNLLPDSVKLYCEYLKSLVVKKKTSSSDEEDENGTKHKGFQAVAQIGAIVCHPITISDVEWRLEVIKFLFLHSFFTVKKPTEILHCETTYEELTPTLRESLKSAFYKAIGSLHQKTDQKISPTELFIQNMFSFGEYVEQLLGSAEFIEPIFPLEKVEESWQKMKSIVHKLNKQSKKDGKVNESHAFQALFLELSLHLFYDAGQMAEVLEELHICCKKALHARKHSGEEENDSEPPWAAVVTDILLSLLSRSSQHLRHTVTFVFPYLIPFITSDALQQILNVISPENADDPMLVDESDEESDAEFDSGSSSEGSDVDEPGTKVDDQFREKIKKALGHAAEVSDAESVVLSDSEMFKLDEHIAEAFRSRVATGHTQMSVEDKTMLNFRLRCLDLVIAFLKSEPPLHLVLQCVEPVLSAFELGHKGKNQEQLLSKVMTTFQTFLSIKKFTNYDGVQKSELKALIEKLIEKSHKETNLNVAKKLYSLCVFLFLCSRRYDNHKKSSEKKSSKTPWYLKPYISALDDFVKSSGSNMYPQFFVQLMETCPEVAFHFISPCKEYAFSSEARIYKKTQCLGLIFEALKFSKNQNSVTKEEWENVGSDLAEAAVEALKEILPNETAKPTYLTELLDIVFTCHTILLEKTSQSVLEKHKDLVPMLESMEKVNKRLPKKAKATRRRIILCLKNETDKKRKLNLKNTENKKQKTDSDNSDEE